MTTQTQHAKRLFNADEYYAMGEAGILPEGGSELIRGVVYMKGVGKPWRFTVDDYYAMAEAGILTHDERVELINGEIIEMSPIGDRHAYSVDEIIDLFFAQLRSRARVRCQNPVRLDGLREIQPDIAILRLRDDLYSTGHPGPADVFLLIEVSDSTLAYDRNVKLPMYANAGIPEIWIVNIPNGVVEVYMDPTAGEYRTRRVFRSEETVSPSSFPDVSLPVSRIVPA